MIDSYSILLISESKATVRKFRTPLQSLGKVEVARSGYDALQLIVLEQFNLALLDFDMSLMGGMEALKHLRKDTLTLPVLIIPRENTFVSDVAKSLEQNAQGYVPGDADDELLLSRCRAFSARANVPEVVARYRRDISRKGRPLQLIGSSGPMNEVFQRVAKVAGSDVSIMLRGESGTGKELVARMLHTISPRADHRFVALNCAAIPEHLLESELFGHEKGAFTGAESQRKGKFEIADGGTLFLDEIGDMSPVLQAKLLRALEYGEFERVGGNEVINTSVRLISATNKDLEEQIESGEFREDLYYRLNVFTVQLPPLRERNMDVALLAIYFVHQFNKKNNQAVEHIEDDVFRLLRTYHWPGNIRELQNTMEQASLLVEGEQLRPEHFPGLPVAEDLLHGEAREFNGESRGIFGRMKEIIPMEQLEAAAIEHALHLTEGNLSRAAEQLGLSRVTLYRKIDKYNLDVTGAE
ncbi:MAG: sigma-54 dependent transcriptional regulator [Candidatus Marinimicrobia bacterium]|nr:sigma-54 dependent transcriptional regulator [Candidatus Neomarinimicrobiota bacterium]MCF7830172.1 sigma-54 dependent transcriptional regulator [Candidatus Neomarinimicrobiota bacterium]MCF7882094.1 sigma-54 dependent transcriptional regulator [Candidatus Neomarinimicrobiota bacterium]